MGVLINPMALAHPLHPIKSRSRNKRQNLWVGLCVSSWRPWFCVMYSIYYIHSMHYSCILSNWNELFLRDIQTKSWCGHAGVLNELILLLLPVWFQVYFRYSLYHNVDIGTIWHCILVSSTPSQSIDCFWVCVGLVLSVIRCAFYHFPDRILFHHDSDHDSCDYHWDFYGHLLLFLVTL